MLVGDILFQGLSNPDALARDEKGSIDYDHKLARIVDNLIEDPDLSSDSSQNSLLFLYWYAIIEKIERKAGTESSHNSLPCGLYTVLYCKQHRCLQCRKAAAKPSDLRGQYERRLLVAKPPPAMDCRYCKIVDFAIESGMICLFFVQYIY